MTWSPGGRWIAFTSFFGDIFATRPDGSRTHRVTRTPGWESDLSWSPSGHRILFSYTDGTPADVLSVRPDGLARQIVMETPGVEYSPAWSPRGRRVALYSEGPNPYGLDPRPGLWLVNPDGGSPRLVLEDREIVDVDW